MANVEASLSMLRMFNSSRFGIDGTAKIIADIAREKWCKS